MDWLSALTRWWRQAFHPEAAPRLEAPQAPAWESTVLLDPDDAPPEAVDPLTIRNLHLRWLLGQSADGPLLAGTSVQAQRLIDELDTVLDSEAACSKLLQRAPNVVPRLLKILRDEDHSSLEVSRWVTRDVMLSAEVMRVAKSAYFQRHKGTMTDMVQAIQLIGDVGLQQAIARVVLKPLFEAGPFALLTRCAERLWLDAERTARMSVAVAQTRGTDGFEAYMAGLLYNVGWNAVLRVWDQQGLGRLVQTEVLSDPSFVPALMLRRDRLMSILVPPWNISPTLNEVTRQLDPGCVQGEPPLELQVLRQGEWLAMLQQAQHRGDCPGGLQPPAELSPVERITYLTLHEASDIP